MRRQPRSRLLLGSHRGMKLTEGIRIHDGNRSLRRSSLRVSRIEIGLRMFELGGVKTKYRKVYTTLFAARG
jgi:hypothetical protein